MTSCAMFFHKPEVTLNIGQGLGGPQQACGLGPLANWPCYHEKREEDRRAAGRWEILRLRERAEELRMEALDPVGNERTQCCLCGRGNVSFEGVVVSVGVTACGRRMEWRHIAQRRDNPRRVSDGTRKKSIHVEELHP
ncbi:hypothetical protein E2C01_090083 [Portunus trituberculatus]|uniref:Uncharacterized protein n=1 Tax=Portunus trituberculatus TaxID=210409 RepID=A0A5B7JKG0_PORTR|nr:hypothetical protein [Portunus trituberculatus]